MYKRKIWFLISICMDVFIRWACVLLETRQVLLTRMNVNDIYYILKTKNYAKMIWSHWCYIILITKIKHLLGTTKKGLLGRILHITIMKQYCNKYTCSRWTIVHNIRWNMQLAVCHETVGWFAINKLWGQNACCWVPKKTKKQTFCCNKKICIIKCCCIRIMAVFP